MYHDSYINDKRESGFRLAGADVYKIRPENFEHQLELIDNYLKSKKLNKDSIRFTFDDGGVSFYTVFAPLLEKYGYKGYFFISTQFIGDDGFMTEDQIKELDKRGHVIGGHSHSHRQLMNTLSFDELLKDWSICTEKLESIVGHKVTCCSLPCGYMSDNMMGALNQLGYKDVYTSEALDGFYVLNRMRIYGRYGLKESMSDEYVLSIVASPLTRLKIKARKALLNFAKKIMGGSYVTFREQFLNKK